MKRRIRLTEGDLRRIVNKSVRRVLRESSSYDNDGSIYDEIDSDLTHIGDVYVSRFYSDENQITLALNKNLRGSRREVIEIMQNYGCDYCTCGANGNYIMMTFEQNNQSF